jgi:hypothetical protein
MEHLLEEDRKKKELAKAQETATPEYAIGLTSTPAEVSYYCTCLTTYTNDLNDR